MTYSQPGTFKEKAEEIKKMSADKSAAYAARNTTSEDNRVFKLLESKGVYPGSTSGKQDSDFGMSQENRATLLSGVKGLKPFNTPRLLG